MTDNEFRSGFVCFVGRPNTGKSTLTNALVGEKIAITSSRPQTTRHTIRGIVHRDFAQLILVDTPGLHRPRTLLGQRLNDLVRDTYSEVDVICLCIPADEKIGPGDRWILEQVRQMAPKTKLVGIVTKIDKVSKDGVAAQLMALSKLLGPEAEVIPVSAVSGEQVELLVKVLAGLMEPGPAFYPDGELTDEPEETLMPSSSGKRRSRVSATNCRTRWPSSSRRCASVRGAPRSRVNFSTSTHCCTSSGPARRAS